MSERTRRFRAARSDPSLVVLEGFHALKHALRFGADVVEAATRDPVALAGLARAVAPDVADALLALARPVEGFDELSPSPVPTGVVAIARRPVPDVATALGGAGPVVFLEGPSRVDNVGAAVRVAAAAGASGVLTSGTKDPWDPSALRGSAGLHFALPVVRVEELPATDRPIVALDPDGDPLDEVPSEALLAFGTEREGLSRGLLERAEGRIRIPMREGVSSLNLAVTVGVALYAVRPRKGAVGESQR